MSTGANIISPSDPGFAEAKFAYDLHDQKPAAICLPTTVAEVQQAVRWARDEGLRIANQATGHVAVALPDLEDALLLKPQIDTEPVVDPAGGYCRVGAGTRWRQVVEAAAAHGMAAMHGSSPTVGVVGYHLGGGLSFYSREHGLACNKVRAIEVVTADGELARIDRENEPDLFWALRGGGGLFATVTAIEFDLLPVGEVYGGASFWPVETAEAALSTWLDWTRTAPESVTSTFRIMNLPPFEVVPEPIRGKQLVVINGVALDKGDGEALTAQLDGLGDPVMAQGGMMPGPAVASLHGDPEDPVPAIGNSTMLDGVGDELVEAFVGAASGESGCTLIAAELRQLGGALRRPDPDGGVASMIDGEFIAFGVGLAPEPGMKAKTEEDLTRLMEAVKPWEGGRQYYNFAVGGAACQDCFPEDDIEALKAIRHEYDPESLYLAPLPL
ncbi:MAG TPA: FAD-binding oxidoreductase [Solirubrobacterales bacterium]|nr:FAD-binding oxidoreductase [Solirubrobacterales bacterium]